MKILICNAGSTSLKFKLWDMPACAVLAEGRVERVHVESRIVRVSVQQHEVRILALDILENLLHISLRKGESLLESCKTMSLNLEVCFSICNLNVNSGNFAPVISNLLFEVIN